MQKKVRITCSKVVDGKRKPYSMYGSTLEDIFDKIRQANKYSIVIYVAKLYKEKYNEYLEKPKPSKQ